MTHIETIKALLENVNSVTLKALKSITASAIWDLDNYDIPNYNEEFNNTIDPLGLIDTEKGLMANVALLAMNYKKAYDNPKKAIRPLSEYKKRVEEGVANYMTHVLNIKKDKSSVLTQEEIENLAIGTVVKSTDKPDKKMVFKGMVGRDVLLETESGGELRIFIAFFEQHGLVAVQ